MDVDIFLVSYRTYLVLYGVVHGHSRVLCMFPSDARSGIVSRCFAVSTPTVSQWPSKRRAIQHSIQGTNMNRRRLHSLQILSRFPRSEYLDPGLSDPVTTIGQKREKQH